MSVTWVIRAPGCAVLSRVLRWAKSTTSPAFLASALPPKIRCHKGQLSPMGSLVPPLHSPTLQRGQEPFPTTGSSRAEPSQPGEHSTGLTVIPTPCWRLHWQQHLPSSSPTTGEMQQNTAVKAVSIHTPEAAPASPSPAKRMRAHTQIIFNLYFNTACKCTAERWPLNWPIYTALRHSKEGKNKQQKSPLHLPTAPNWVSCSLWAY